MEELEKKAEEKKENKSSEQKIGKRKEKIKNWLKNPYNLAFLGIMIFVIAIRFYYFWLTKNQPLWWDESEYMSAAKSYAGIVDYKLQAIRLPGFPIFISIFFILGITNESLIRFIALFIPSLIIILLVYFNIKEMYRDKKIALISMLIISVLWENLFYSNRFHTENFALVFELLAIFIMFRVYIKNQPLSFIKPKYSLLWILVFSLLSAFFRPGNLMFLPAIFLFLIILNKSKIFKGKGWIFAGIITLFLVASLFILPKLPHSGLFAYFGFKNPVAWNVIYNSEQGGVFYGFYASIVPYIPPIFLYTFIFGIFLVILNFFLSFERFKKLEKNPEDMEFKSDIFNFLLIITVLIAFIFMIRPTGIEYRWFFPLITGLLAFTSKGVINISEYIGGIARIKTLSSLLIIVLVLLGAYTQVVHADQIIKMKLDSYIQVEQSGLWMRDNSNKGDSIISASLPQHAYYSERKVYDFYTNGSNENESVFNEELKNIKPKYLVISIFEPGFTPQWAYNWSSQHSDLVTPVKVYFLDQQQTQPALVIYKFNKY